MNSKFSIYIIVIFLITVTALGRLLFTNDAFFYNTLSKIPIVSAILYFCPPDDYYIPIIDSDVVGEIKKNCVLKYSGRYELCITNIDSNNEDKCNLELELQIVDNNKCVLSKSSNDARIFYTWENGKYYYRYSYFSITIPDEAPLNKEVTVKIGCKGDIGLFVSKFPNAKIKFVKRFDK